MQTLTDVKYIVRDPAVLNGVPTIEGHRIAVYHLAWWYRQGQTAEQLAHEFHLALSQVYAALVYYLDHQQEVDQQLEDQETAFHAQADAHDSPIGRRIQALLQQQPSSEA